MANRSTGILLDDTGDIAIDVRRDSNGLITGGLVIGDVTNQNQRTILTSEKGEIKPSLLLGVGIASFLDDDEPSLLLREVRVNLRDDGQTVNSCGFNPEGKLVIIGGYD
ncbi:hypothetical protein [Dysgonomonas sp. ZJ709]|uniref:hypothetical protein n=1 Tax=Dysgonomonas sp. ZJ709 TaxID=2709797 RepID=UPI0013EDB0F0|nr:hypothetical protein [Dysgonomonas sp. ZJ709]